MATCVANINVLNIPDAIIAIESRVAFNFLINRAFIVIFLMSSCAVRVAIENVFLIGWKVFAG